MVPSHGSSSRRTGRPALAGLALAVALAVALGAFVGERLLAAPPALAVKVAVPAAVVAAPGSPAAVTLPPRGALALESDADGRLAARDPDTPRPIASIAKTLTALAVLDAHPLDSAAEGPVLTLAQADVDLFRAETAADGSALPVTAGERLSERQLLLALMLPSANNIASTLARWVDGSVPAFTVRLNALAHTLGMASTHLEDASGFSPRTTSTPADLVKLARAALARPALAEIVATRSATLPDGTVLRTLDALLFTEPGWLGIKTGSTPQAGGCLLFAARRPNDATGKGVTLVGAVLGQTDLNAAEDAAKHAVDSAFAGYVPVDVATVPLPVTGEVVAAWGSNSGVEPQAAASSTIEVRQGASFAVALMAEPLHAPAPAGARAATVTVSLNGRVMMRRSLVLSRGIPGPGVAWRLSHG